MDIHKVKEGNVFEQFLNHSNLVKSLQTSTQTCTDKKFVSKWNFDFKGCARYIFANLFCMSKKSTCMKHEPGNTFCRITWEVNKVW